jgi:Fur family ferric uptake transcriptional regulator
MGAFGAIEGQIRDELRSRGQRWTPQRRMVLEVLDATSGHVTASEIVERCRAREPNVIPSTVYRTLDVLEELGYVSHSHSARGREEYHVLPAAIHAHLECRNCGRTLEMPSDEAAAIASRIHARHGFAPDLAHMTIVGLCSECGTERIPATL